MFGLLKEKFKKMIKSFSEKVEKKEKVAEELRKEIENLSKEETEKAIEKIKLKVEEIPEVKKEVEEEIKKAKPKEKKGLFKKIAEKITKKISEKTLSEEDVEPILNELGKDLIEADVAYSVVERMKNDLKKSLIGKEIKRGKEKEVITLALKESMLKILEVPSFSLTEKLKNKKPVLILFLGFNGSGKTTSLAKVGKWLIEKGYSCVFAAADTFRAGSEEQLEEHAKKIGVRVVKHKYGADPAAVIFDAVRHAEANGIDFVLADTAGRSHTNENLMSEMEKIIRVNKPDVKVLVIDSLTGNDAVLQAKFFGKLGIDALIFTKVDVNEKGGAILSVVDELKKPILFLCNGQDYSNLEEFSPQKFVENLLS
jgi:fused signal recognition particle receptor